MIEIRSVWRICSIRSCMLGDRSLFQAGWPEGTSGMLGIGSWLGLSCEQSERNINIMSVKIIHYWTLYDVCITNSINIVSDSQSMGLYLPLTTFIRAGQILVSIPSPLRSRNAEFVDDRR
jgi:hypothetical protein